MSYHTALLSAPVYGLLPNIIHKPPAISHSLNTKTKQINTVVMSLTLEKKGI